MWWWVGGWGGGGGGRGGQREKARSLHETQKAVSKKGLEEDQEAKGLWHDRLQWKGPCFLGGGGVGKGGGVEGGVGGGGMGGGGGGGGGGPPKRKGFQVCAPSKVGQGFLKRNKNYAPGQAASTSG